MTFRLGLGWPGQEQGKVFLPAGTEGSGIRGDLGLLEKQKNGRGLGADGNGEVAVREVACLLWASGGTGTSVRNVH